MIAEPKECRKCLIQMGWNGHSLQLTSKSIDKKTGVYPIYRRELGHLGVLSECPNCIMCSYS